MKRTASLVLIEASVVAKPGKAKGPEKEGAATYLVHGIATRATQACTDPPTVSGLVTVDAKKGTGSAASALAEKNGASQAFSVNPGPKIEMNGEEATLADLQVGDEAKVRARAEASAKPPSSPGSPRSRTSPLRTQLRRLNRVSREFTGPGPSGPALYAPAVFRQEAS